MMKHIFLLVILFLGALSACSREATDVKYDFVNRMDEQKRRAKVPEEMKPRTNEGMLKYALYPFMIEEAPDSFIWETEFYQHSECTQGQYFIFMATGWGGGPIGTAMYCENGDETFFWTRSTLQDAEMFQKVPLDTLLECPPVAEDYQIPRYQDLTKVFLLSSREDAIWDGFDRNCYRIIFAD